MIYRRKARDGLIDGANGQARFEPPAWSNWAILDARTTVFGPVRPMPIVPTPRARTPAAAGLACRGPNFRSAPPIRHYDISSESSGRADRRGKRASPFRAAGVVKMGHSRCKDHGFWPRAPHAHRSDASSSYAGRSGSDIVDRAAVVAPVTKKKKKNNERGRRSSAKEGRPKLTRKAKRGCNTRTSQEVTHPSTTLAQARLTAEF
ncbi:hypothetical protein AAC387_Pa02g2057 [Persea americana]